MIEWVGPVGFHVTEPADPVEIDSLDANGNVIGKVKVAQWKPFDPPLTEQQLNEYIEKHVRDIAETWWIPKGCSYSWKFMSFQDSFVVVELSRIGPDRKETKK